MRHSLVAIALASALALPQSALVQAAPTGAATTQTQTEKGYLGVTIDRLPEVVRAQLPTTIPPEQGVLVDQVIQGSPAAKAGLEPFDILLQYNDQKLYSPDQLTRLVAADTSGQSATLTIVRGGKISTLSVTLGRNSEPTPSAQWFPGPGTAPPPFGNWRHPAIAASRPPADHAGEKAWGSFDALSLEKVKGDQYRAAVGYLASDGSHKKLEFKGTRDQIRKKILARKDLPALERRQLLQALNSRDELFPDANWPSMSFRQGMPQTAPWWDWHPDF